MLLLFLTLLAFAEDHRIDELKPDQTTALGPYEASISSHHKHAGDGSATGIWTLSLAAGEYARRIEHYGERFEIEILIGDTLLVGRPADKGAVKLLLLEQAPISMDTEAAEAAVREALGDKATGALTSSKSSGLMHFSFAGAGDPVSASVGLFTHEVLIR